MKKIIVLFFILASLCLSFGSCTTQDNQLPPEKNAVLGLWRFSQVRDDPSQTYIDLTPKAIDGWIPTSFAFNNNDTYTWSGFFGNSAGTYTVANSTISLFTNGQKTTDIPVLSLSDKTMEISLTYQSNTLYFKLDKQASAYSNPIHTNHLMQTQPTDWGKQFKLLQQMIQQTANN